MCKKVHNYVRNRLSVPIYQIVRDVYQQNVAFPNFNPNYFRLKLTNTRIAMAYPIPIVQLPYFSVNMFRIFCMTKGIN